MKMNDCQNNLYLEHMNEQSFDWLTWRSGSISEILKIPHRYETIVNNSHIIRQYAIGYCKADNLQCRPKSGYIAIMFNIGDFYNWWTHFTVNEFKRVFPEIKI
jgi:hypothetical protein